MKAKEITRLFCSSYITSIRVWLKMDKHDEHIFVHGYCDTNDIDRSFVLYRAFLYRGEIRNMFSVVL